MKRLMKYMAVTVVSIFVCMISVIAMAPVDTSRTGTVTLENYPVDQAEFKFYKIADADEMMIFTLRDPYSKYADTLIVNNINDQETWKDTAENLANLVNGEQIKPDYTFPYKDGKCEAKLGVGLYLILSDPVEYNKKIYSTNVMMVSVPTTEDLKVDDTVEEWIYDFSLNVKYEETPVPPQDYKVLKVWVNDGKGQSRPAGIKVRILENNKPVETVTLNASNNWSYSWKGDKDAVYSVQEVSVPSGYKVTYSKQKTTFTIKNTKGTPPPNTGDPTDLVGPIAGLCLGGLAAVLAGYFLIKKRKQEEQ